MCAASREIENARPERVPIPKSETLPSKVEPT